MGGLVWPSYVQQCELISASVLSCMAGTSLGTPARATLKYTLCPLLQPLHFNGLGGMFKHYRTVARSYFTTLCSQVPVLYVMAHGYIWKSWERSEKNHSSAPTCQLRRVGFCLYLVFRTVQYTTIHYFVSLRKNVWVFSRLENSAHRC